MYSLELECIGDNLEYKNKSKIKIYRHKIWVAEILGFSEEFMFKRKFLKGNKDYTNSNGAGSRGIFLYFILQENKIYEIQKPIKWKKDKRFFAIIKNNILIEITIKEVIECLVKSM